MSILAKNIRTIRRELKCTQGSMAEILNVGFRTYVRYEAGERDAPVGVLVRVARLGNISLERLLREEVSRFAIVPVNGPVPKQNNQEIQLCDLRKGTVRFKRTSGTSLITLDHAEVRLLSMYRKLPEQAKEGFGRRMSGKLKAGKSSMRARTGPDKKTRKELKAYEKLLKEAGELKPDPSHQTGRPGRKKLDRKSLREKISVLKSLAQLPGKL